MNKIATYKKFSMFQLTRELAQRYGSDIVGCLNLIPYTYPHTTAQLMSLKKGDRVQHAKWQHSLIALDGLKKLAGVIIGYEREKEGNEYYPFNTIYLNSLSVMEKYQQQGLGRQLLQIWLEYNAQLGFIVLEGSVNFSVQTNNADWNKHVQRLYESVGFVKRAEKRYENRVDNVYGLKQIDTEKW